MVRVPTRWRIPLPTGATIATVASATLVVPRVVSRGRVITRTSVVVARGRPAVSGLGWRRVNFDHDFAPTQLLTSEKHHRLHRFNRLRNNVICEKYPTVLTYRRVLDDRIARFLHFDIQDLSGKRKHFAQLTGRNFKQQIAKKRFC